MTVNMLFLYFANDLKKTTMYETHVITYNMHVIADIYMNVIL